MVAQHFAVDEITTMFVDSGCIAISTPLSSPCLLSSLHIAGVEVASFFPQPSAPWKPWERAEGGWEDGEGRTGKWTAGNRGGGGDASEVGF